MIIALNRHFAMLFFAANPVITLCRFICTIHNINLINIVLFGVGLCYNVVMHFLPPRVSGGGGGGEMQNHI